MNHDSLPPLFFVLRRFEEVYIFGASTKVPKVLYVCKFNYSRTPLFIAREKKGKNLVPLVARKQH